MSAREDILSRIRTGLGPRPFTPAPPAVLSVGDRDDSRVARLLGCARALGADTHHAHSLTEAREYVAAALAGRSAIASNAPFLKECGVTDLADVRTGIYDREELRAICAVADCGITSADYALADTGTLVMLSSAEEARMISLLPPAHIAVIPVERILNGLDDLLAIVPKPGDRTSSMVLITGPSRTGDIEGSLVRGVHGPGEIHLVVVGS